MIKRSTTNTRTNSKNKNGHIINIRNGDGGEKEVEEGKNSNSRVTLFTSNISNILGSNLSKVDGLGYSSDGDSSAPCDGKQSETKPTLVANSLLF